MSHQHAVGRALRRGNRVRDSVFDFVYPLAVQRASSRFWTPVQTAATAANWIKASGCRSILDVGAGAGKFCIVTSLALQRSVTGVEQRARLVEAARRAAATYAAEARFVHGTLETIDPGRFDCFYLFNPFAENVFDRDEWLDSDVELSQTRWFSDLARVESWLDQAPDGTSIITYNGFGGRIPGTYRLLRSARVDGNWLRIWAKRARAVAKEAFYIEIDELVLSSSALCAMTERAANPEASERLRQLLARPLGCALS